MKKQLILFILLISSAFSYAQRDTQYILAENYFKNSEYEKALQIYKKLVAKSPYNTTYLYRVTTCYQELNQFNQAESLLLSKLKKKPSLAFINVFLGYNYERQDKEELAEKYYRSAIKAIKKKATYGGNIATTFKNYNKLDLAIEAYKTTTEYNKNANYEIQIAQIYGEKGDFEFMFQEYINYVDRDKKYVNIVKRYTSKYINDDPENENNILFKKALLRKSASNPKNVWNDLLSWLFTNQKQYGKALIQYKALYERDQDNIEDINELGNIAFENKEYEVAKECFDFVIENTTYISEKFSAIYMNLLIVTEGNIEDIEGAEKQFKEVLDEFGVNKNTFLIQTEYANFLTFKKNKPEEAMLILEESLKYAENRYQRAGVKLKLGEVLVYQEKFNKALIYFSQVQTKFKNHKLGQEARFRVAQASYFKNDFKWAKAQLKVLKGSATQLIANDAADLFLVISDNEPKDSIPTGLSNYAKASLFSFQNKNEAAITILNQVLENFNGQPIEDEALYKQAKLYERQKKYKEAVVNYEKIIAIDAMGILVDDAYYSMAEMYHHLLNDSEKASTYYQKIIFDYPASIYLVDARKKYRKLRGDSI